MEDIKIDVVKPVDLPQFTGPLSKLDARSNDLNVVKYPSDLGTPQGRNSKNHFVTFRIYDIEPAGIVSEGRSTAGEATLALPNAGALIKEFNGIAGAVTGAIGGTAAGALVGGTSGAIVGGAVGAALGDKFLGDAASFVGSALKTGFSLAPPISQIKSCISLYMPDTLTATYDANYEEMSLTADLGPTITTLRAIDSSISAVKGGTVGNAIGTNPAVLQAIQGTLGGKISGLGINSENLTTLLQRAQGFALNPQLQMVYRGTGLRSFQLSFTFTPKSASEATQVNNIINQFRFYFSPSLAQRSGSITQSTTNSMFLVPPSVFEIEFYVNGLKSVNLPRYGRCVMTGLDVNHAPNGFAAYDDSSMVQTTLQMSFKEMDILTRDNFNDTDTSKTRR
jgi:uncharacterized protein YcfJ